MTTALRSSIVRAMEMCRSGGLATILRVGCGLALLLCAMAPHAMAQEPSQASESAPAAASEGRFVVKTPGAIGSMGPVLLRGIAVKGLRFERVDAEGAVDEAFSGRVAIRGLLNEAGDAHPGVVFEEGVATLDKEARVEEALFASAAGAEEQPIALRILPSWIAIVPPVVAIVLAVLLRQVLLALFLGVFAGVVAIEGSLVDGLFRSLDRHLISALTDTGHAKILVFSGLLGGVVAMLGRLGGMRAIVEALARRGRTSRGIQGTTWGMGLLVFFDDYANALLVGNTMRPASDRFRISREKLAYLVDSTSAPVACIAVISTWIAAQINYIQGWIESPEGTATQARLGFDGAYELFLISIPYGFYPIFALVFALLIVVTRRDFGPMLKAERRARSGGGLWRPGSSPLTGADEGEMAPADPKRLHWWNGLLPLGVIVGATILGLYWNGLAALGSEVPTDTWARIRAAFGNADSYDVLLAATLLGLLCAWGLALGQRLMNLSEVVDTTVKGIASMITAMIVLILAWTLADLIGALHTASWLIDMVKLDFNLLPAVTFVLAAVVGFATGTAWGTMGVLIPIVLAYAGLAGLETDIAHHTQVLVSSLGAVLAGAVFGDHCSPISDTTVMSSMAAGADHVDHVKTQFPYALTVGGVAILVGYLPAGYDVPAWASLLAGVGLLALIVRFVGRHAEPAGAGAR